tara:strand:- start:1753 stop:2832 length:1080 start_codon:yes stop_codon:yes gene_type:complete
MKIEIISDDRLDSSQKNLSRVAWELSRSPDDKTPLDTILSIDAPVNEVPSIVMSVECTILEREIFASFRDHVMWARTSRVDDPAKFETPLYFESKYKYKLKELRSQIEQDIKEGMIQDIYRMHMPLCSKTSFTTRVSWRGLIKIYKFFEFLSEIDEYFMLGLSQLEKKFGLKEYARNYSFVNPIPKLNKSDENVSGKIGPIITIFQTMSIALRAQLVRHRNFTFTDNLLEIIEKGDSWIKPMGNPMKISISAEVNFWKTVINKRQCWIAQYGIWEDVIMKAQEYLEISEQDLPCNKGFCPYTRDAELRHTDDDPGAPCPIHSKLSNMPIDPKYMESVKVEASYRPAFWQKHIKELELNK